MTRQSPALNETLIPGVRSAFWRPVAAVLAFGVLSGVLAQNAFARDRPNGTNHGAETNPAGPSASPLVSGTGAAPVLHGDLQSDDAADSAAVNPAYSEVRTVGLPPLIEQVQFNQSVLSFREGVTAGPGSGNLEIQLTAPEAVDPDRVHFRYRLIGVDSDWVEAGREREAIYKQLAPGHYLFELEETDAGNVREPRIASLGIDVFPFYWKTGWFRTLCAIFVFILTIAFCWLRHRRLVSHARKLQEQVNRSKAELHLAIRVAEDAQRALKDQAMKDSLTGLWNRRVIFEMLEREISRAQRDHLPIAVVMIDLDHFKNINDTYGHLTGDAVLEEVAKRIANLMRPYDLAGRYGGEEFLIVLPGCSPTNGIQRADHFRRAIADSAILTSSVPLTVTCSLGVASHDEAMPAEDLIHQADEALYCAKRLGRNCVRTSGGRDVADSSLTGTGRARLTALPEDRSARTSDDACIASVQHDK
jgi:diguanylate cyclase (GGDEF)-like protein